MIKILQCSLKEDAQSMKSLMKMNIIKYIYGNDEEILDYDYVVFIVLEKNADDIINLIKNDCDSVIKQSITEYLEDSIFCDTLELTVKNSYQDEIVINSNNVLNMLKEEECWYFTYENKFAIYNSKNPRQEIERILHKIGREQAKKQIKLLLEELEYGNQKFE